MSSSTLHALQPDPTQLLCRAVAAITNWVWMSTSVTEFGGAEQVLYSNSNTLTLISYCTFVIETHPSDFNIPSDMPGIQLHTVLELIERLGLTGNLN